MEKKELLQEMYKGTRMGIDSIEALKNYVEDRPLINILNNQKKEYQTLADELELEGAKTCTDLKPLPVKDKVMMWGGVIFNTLKDRSPSKIAEIMIQGTNMGIISLTKALNKYEGEQTPYADRLMNIYKTNLDTFKVYL